MFPSLLLFTCYIISFLLSLYVIALCSDVGPNCLTKFIHEKSKFRVLIYVIIIKRLKFGLIMYSCKSVKGLLRKHCKLETDHSKCMRD